MHNYPSETSLLKNLSLADIARLWEASLADIARLREAKKQREDEQTYPQELDLIVEIGISHEELATMSDAECHELASALADIYNLENRFDISTAGRTYEQLLHDATKPAFASEPAVEAVVEFDFGDVFKGDPFLDFIALCDFHEAESLAAHKPKFAFGDVLLEDTADLDGDYLGVILEDVYQNIFMLQSYRDERVNRRSTGWFAWGETEPSFPVFPARIISIPLV